MPSISPHFWCQGFLSNQWISCEALIDKALYEGMLKIDSTIKEKIPTIEWDGESNLTLLDYWITEDQGIVFPSWDDALAHLRRSNEGMPPRIIDKLFAGVIYPLFARKTDEIPAKGRLQ
jgi:hypothetical protein